MNNIIKTDFLTSTSGWLSGVGSVLDLGSTLIEFNESDTEVSADIIAIRLDWAMVGQDLSNSICAFEITK